ncbi:hypothetical protein FLAT13_03395 [Flavobacterium salmonis]|uniref:Uncharacterized protein n=1 Tax=Flavobacterium salmonis TaxID=2654844 RepID=A0A6V6Z4B5_9FLAO|nr:hypothetical protein FLAT13_03395 [Flavobacterium salmonis]
MHHIYQNSFGEIYTDRIILMVNSQKKTFSIKNIKKIRFIKRKTFTLYYVILLTAALFFTILQPSEQSLIIVLIALVLTLISFNLKLNQHKIIIIIQNDFLKIDVKKKISSDAENLINYLKQLHKL